MRIGFESALGCGDRRERADLVVLAGFMRVLGAAFVARYEGRMLNIHPSLLPAYPGPGHPPRGARRRGAIPGCTVHFVTARMSITARSSCQGAVAVHDGDDEATLCRPSTGRRDTRSAGGGPRLFASSARHRRRRVRA
jgi:phosphoribosylglycinamide formyltransferase-1